MKQSLPFLLTIIIIMLVYGANAQVTPDEARAVDSSVLYSGYFQSPVFYDTNYFTGSSGQGYFIFTRGCGLDMNISNYYVAWTGVENATAQQEEDINAQAGEAFKRFDLNNYADSSAYREALQEWLNSLGIPVGIAETNAQKATIKVYPNPATNMVTIQLSDSKTVSTLKVLNSAGKQMLSTRISGVTQINTGSWPAGVYLLIFDLKGIKQRKMLMVR